MLILAVDTSTNRGSVALIQTTDRHLKCIDEVTWDKSESHSEILTVEASQLLSRCKLSFENIDVFAVGIGPGSFTGIRVGLNFIKSLAYVYNKPVKSISTLLLQALPALENADEVIATLPAFRNLVYVARYKKTPAGAIEEVMPPSAITTDELESLKMNKVHLLNDLPKASDFRFLSLEDLDQRTYLRWFETVPLYVRASEAEEKLRRGL